MEEHFLENWMQQIDPSSERGSHVGQREPWYNPHGDCIQFQTVNEAVVADRVDNYLTVYRSAVNNDPIGFKIKDVRQLLHKYGCEGIEVQALRGQRIVLVTGLLLRAYQTEPPTIGRVSGYASAFNSLTVNGDRDRIALPVEG